MNRIKEDYIMFNKVFAITGLVIGATVLAVSVPTLIVSHVKSVKEKGKDFESSYENTRDSLIVTSVASVLVASATKVIVDSIKILKH
jgi:hypothetical protein